MQAREIAYEQWQPFFNDFTQLHQGKRVNVETMGDGDFGVRSQWCGLPLVGIVSVHPKAGDDEWIEVIARDSPKTHATHSIAKPAKVELAEEDGQPVAVQIESADQPITMIRFDPSHENLPPGFRVC
jgi:TusA-related sulfurtransferase